MVLRLNMHRCSVIVLLYKIFQKPYVPCANIAPGMCSQVQALHVAGHLSSLHLQVLNLKGSC